MQTVSIARPWLLALPLVLAATSTLAQTHPPSDSALNFGGVLAKKAPAPTVPDVPAPPSAWPRLDPGAVLCATEDDLVRRAEILRGEQAGPADCHQITQPTAIHIVQRAGLGRTQVQITGHTDTGWTDAWLPASPPPGSTSVVSGQIGGAPAASIR
jgi:hypothetical protein